MDEKDTITVDTVDEFDELEDEYVPGEDGEEYEDEEYGEDDEEYGEDDEEYGEDDEEEEAVAQDDSPVVATGKPKRATPKGRKWANLSGPKFRKRHPMIGVRLLAAAGVEDPKITKRGPRSRKKRTYRYNRVPPSAREGVRFQAIIVHFETRAKLQELKKFYGKSMAGIIREHVDELFEKATKEAEVLARIEENRRKREEEASNTDTPKRKYNV
jgi:hypothetical protein